jgi:Suppressor of fused protein (SUFU)
MEVKETNLILESHIQKYFDKSEIFIEFWNQGPITEILPEYKVLKVWSKDLNLWAYISIGSWNLFDNSKLEFVILASDDNSKYIERLAMTTYYHSLHRLGLNHTFPLGEPWIENSTLEYCLVSKPYPLGEEFEICNIRKEHIHFFWLLPITEKEREFKVENGTEALESKFESEELEFWDAKRKSVI